MIVFYHLQFITDLINELSIGSDSSQTQVGFVIFGDGASSEFYLNTHSNKADLIDAVNGITYLKEGTNTQQGLIEMQDVQFTEARGDREGIKNIAVVLTDGDSTVNPTRTIPEAERARASGIEIISIGIGSKVTEAELKGISSMPQTKDANYFMSSFEGLNKIGSLIISEACGTSQGKIQRTTVIPSTYVTLPKCRLFCEVDYETLPSFSIFICSLWLVIINSKCCY